MLNITGILQQCWQLTKRECHRLATAPIYTFCMVLFPLLVIFFFTSLMQDGLPNNLPAGVVDLDKTPTTRALVRNLDSYQTTKIIGHYANLNEARRAIQRGEIYAFYYIPKQTTDKLLSARQPKVSFYVSYGTLMPGALLYRDMRTISTLVSSKVSMTTMQMKGLTDHQIMAVLQPIRIDTHPTSNPWINYNIYLSNTIVPGCIMLFILLVTTYSIGTELKFKTSKSWMKMAHNNIYVAMAGKMLPQTVVFLLITFFYQWYFFEYLHFPHLCSFGSVIVAGTVMVLSCQGFGIFMFGLFPSLRMSMSMCALWSVLSFSISGFAFPVPSMDPAIQALSWLFPLRSYFMIYQMQILNGYPVVYAWPYYGTLAVFMMLPYLVLPNFKKVMLKYVYIP